MLGLLLGIIFSFWVYSVVKNKGGNPWGWIVGTIFIWPIFTIIVGLRYKVNGLIVSGSLGFTIIASLVGYMIAIG